jgi:hypothetical protein
VRDRGRADNPAASVAMLLAIPSNCLNYLDIFTVSHLVEKKNSAVEKRAILPDKLEP